LSGHGARIRQLAFAPDARELVSASHDRTIRVWDCSVGTEHSRSELGVEYLESAAFSADGKTLVASQVYGEPIAIRESATGRELHRIQVAGSKGSVVALSPDGRILASGSVAPRYASEGEDRSLHLWEMATGREVARFRPGSTTVVSLAFAPDGRSLVS